MRITKTPKQQRFYCPCCHGAKQKHWHVACGVCWAKVPKAMQDEVWREYQFAPGSDKHRAAVAKCYRYLIDLEKK